MPRLKPSKSKLIQADIDAVIRRACVLQNRQQKEILEFINMSETTLLRRRKRPDEWRIKELRKLALLAETGIMEVFRYFDR